MILEASDLGKTFKTRTSVVEAVKAVNLGVRYGEIFGFLGPNGAGKSTTIRMLTTLLRPSSGQATIAGYDLLRQAHHIRYHIGYVSQAGGADADATPVDNLILQARLYGMSYSTAMERTQALIQALELETCATRVVKTFSGGQRRRLDLALGMVHKPRLLFLDEPTAGLDPQSRARLWDEIRALRDEGTTVFLTTHYLEEADALCDRLAIIDHGEIVIEGTPDLLKRQIAGDVITLGLSTHNNDFTHIQDLLDLQPFVREVHSLKDGLRLYVDRGEQVLPDILRTVDSAGLSVQTIALTRPTLEDVFLRQTGRALRETNGTHDKGESNGASSFAAYAKELEDEALS